MLNTLIEAKNVGLNIAGKDILYNVDLTLKRGQITTIIGTNGSGKTSLLKLLIGRSKPSNGVIERSKNLSIGYMPQQLLLDELLPLRVWDFLHLSRLGKTQEIQQWLNRLNITSLKYNSVHSLSGGQWQRVLLIRALLNKPDVLFLDEPMQGIDLAGQSELYKMIPKLRDELNCAVLMVSHDLHLVMVATDEVICLNKHVCCSGHPSEVTQNPAYLNLFGQEHAPYLHQHNHQHGLDGTVHTSGLQDV